MAEALQVLDPGRTGAVDMGLLKQYFGKVAGLGELDEEDVQFLLDYGDADCDGKISLEDFAKLGGFSAEDDARKKALPQADNEAIERAEPEMRELAERELQE